MDVIGVRELRQHASRWLERVRRGESIVVTDRGRPAAKLVPIETEGFDQLVAEGLVSGSDDQLLDELERAGGPTTGAPLSARLEELRGDER
jgi:prevent-host-death family protein